MVKKVAIFGGSGGIGKEIVYGFFFRGFDVLVIDLQEPTFELLSNPRVAFHRVDVTNHEALRGLAKTLASTPLHHIVSLAGGALESEFQGFCSMSLSGIEDSIRLNLISHLWIAFLFTPLLVSNQDTSLTFVSSINAKKDFGLATYSAAKAGLSGAVVGLATEFGKRGTRVNVVLPGTVPTPKTQREPKDFEALQKSTILGRFASPSEVATTIIAVAVNFTGITGQELVVDCGQVVSSDYS